MGKEITKGNQKIIGCAESGSGETFGNLVVTAVYVDDENEAEERIKLEAKDITQISCWEDIEEKSNDQLLLHGNRFVTKVITNEEYNENYTRKNDIMTETYVQVLRELDKRYPGSRIVVNSFFGTDKQDIDKFKEALHSEYILIDTDHVLICANASSETKAVSLASKISAYICDLGYDHVQEILDNIYKMDPGTELCLPKNSPGVNDLSDFLLKLKPEKRNEFINKFTKKSFDNVKHASYNMKE